MLPDGNGLDLLQELRSAGNKVPVIMLTAWGEPKDVSRGYLLGATAYLSKPFDYDATLSAIEGIFSSREEVPEVVQKDTLTLNLASMVALRNANDNNQASLVLSLTREATPNAEIDYADENLKGLLTTADYTINGADITLDANAVMSGSPAFTSTATAVAITDPLPKVYSVLAHFGTWTGSGTSFARVDAEHTKFVRLLYGDTQIASSNYTITQGSTIITLNEAHLQTYANGTHWFVAEYPDGTSENIRLDVNVAAASTSPGVPQTGDNSNMTVLWVALICAALGILCLILWRKRQRMA